MSDDRQTPKAACPPASHFHWIVPAVSVQTRISLSTLSEMGAGSLRRCRLDNTSQAGVSSFKEGSQLWLVSGQQFTLWQGVDDYPTRAQTGAPCLTAEYRHPGCAVGTAHSRPA